jgi:CRP/FNR family cyclic AMP-dependent transcriptional regulator
MEELFSSGVSTPYGRGDKVTIDGLVHYVEDGAIGLYSIEDGARRFIFGYRPGDILPYSFASSIFPQRSYVYIALQKTALKSIPLKRFRINSLKPAYAKAVIENLIHINQLQLERLNNLQHPQVLVRLLERLCFYAVRFGTDGSDEVIIDIPISHVDVASSIGTSRETVNRYMKQLEALGVLSVRRQYITIHSYTRLTKIAAEKRLPHPQKRELLRTSHS